jgi:hypothetical protein
VGQTQHLGPHSFFFLSMDHMFLFALFIISG